MSYVEIERPIPHTTVIRMNREDRMNSMSFDLVVPLHDAIEEVARDNDTHCVILTGTGRGFFSRPDGHGDAGDLVSRLFQHERGNGGVHPSGHGDRDFHGSVPPWTG